MAAIDINPVAVAAAFKTLVLSSFPNYKQSVPTETEKQIAEVLFQKFSLISTDYEFIEDHQNELGPVSAPSSEEQMSSEEQLSSEGSRVCSQDFRKPSGFVSIKQKAKILKFMKDNPDCKFKSINRQYKCYNQRGYRKRWTLQVQEGGTRNDILYEIHRHTLKMFQEARADYKPVHDVDLRRWALQKATEFPTFRRTFVASHRWIQRFKRINKISSRKVQRLVSRREIVNEEEILRSAEEFREEMLELQPDYEDSCIWNTDQVGFCYEYSSPRTLSHTNEKFTFGSAFSPKNRITHSYTAQYIISAAGEIIGDVFLCLQEPSGRLSDNVQDKIFSAPNVCLTCSKSGKLTSTHVKFFIDQVVKPETNGRSKVLYTLDQWGGHKNPELYEDIMDDDGFQVKVLPKHTTPYLQPLDVYFNRQLKYLVKKIYSAASLKYVNISPRNDIVKIQSLVHFTLKSSQFKEMIRFCFLKAGIIEGEREYFKNVKEVCFSFNETECSMCDCQDEAFICCSWCESVICFDHILPTTTLTPV